MLHRHFGRAGNRQAISQTYFNDPGRNTTFVWTVLIIAGEQWSWSSLLDPAYIQPFLKRDASLNR
jgi:hypothetical protein